MAEHWCEEHNCKFYKNEKDGKTWYSHKRQGGSGYCNEPKETTIEVVKPKAKVDEVTPTPPSAEFPKSQMTSAEWAAKDKVTRKSIERQTSLNAAVELAKQVEGIVTTGKIIATAKKFELYLETGMDIEALAISKVKEGDKTRLVEAVKAQGGIEQKGG